MILLHFHLCSTYTNVFCIYTQEYKVSIWSADNRDNATLREKLERWPRKDETFRLRLTNLLSLQRGVSYKVCLHLCNKFGCSDCFDRGLAFVVPTLPPPTSAPTEATQSPGSKIGDGTNGGLSSMSMSSSSSFHFLGLLGMFLASWWWSSW